jgi:hypothetical protein
VRAREGRCAEPLTTPQRAHVSGLGGPVGDLLGQCSAGSLALPRLQVGLLRQVELCWAVGLLFRGSRGSCAAVRRPCSRSLLAAWRSGRARRAESRRSRARAACPARHPAARRWPHEARWSPSSRRVLYRSEAATRNACSTRASSDRHFPSTPWILFATATWVWRSGSPVRESRWPKAAATSPVVSICATPACPVRVNAACSSIQGEGAGDRLVVGILDGLADVRTAESPQHRCRLHRREDEVVAGHRPAYLSGLRCSVCEGHPESGRSFIHAGGDHRVPVRLPTITEQCPHLCFGRGRALDAERAGPATDPPTRRVALRGVVVGE